ncbi:MAG: prepilin-type N-terminal cleavage/methylation domain-containing protein [Roseateles sp.]
MPLNRMNVHRKRQLGLTLVELMVGITVGLIVTAGASLMAVNQISEHRRITIEVQMQQDLRIIAELIAQEVRRAGFRAWGELGVWAPGTGAGGDELASQNPYENLAASSNSLTYTFESSPFASILRQTKPITDATDDSDHFGFQIDAGELKAQLGKGNWQPISDKGSYVFDAASSKIEVSTQTVSLADFCDKPCGGAGDCPPQQEVRRVDVTLVAKSLALKDVTRTIKVSERIRADKVTGTCGS